MLVTIFPAGIGSEPITVEATLMLAQHENGTPFCVAGLYGPEGVIKCAHAQDESFNKVLRQLGINRMIICDPMPLPGVSQGAVLLSSPS